MVSPPPQLVGAILVSLLLFCTHGVNSDDVCPEGWLRLDNQCYLIRGGHQKAADARDICTSVQAELATVTDSVAEFLYSQAHAACKDVKSTDECREFADNGTCSTDYDEAQTNCRFSCGLCLSLCSNILPQSMCVSFAQSQTCSDTDMCAQACGCDGFSEKFWVQRKDAKCAVLNITKPKDEALESVECSPKRKAGFICQRDIQAPAVSPVSPDRKGCPVNSVGYKDKCYILNEIPRTWEEAKQDCVKFDNASLASFENEEVFELVNNHMASETSSVWIGLSKSFDNVYTWQNNDKITYLPWGPYHTGKEPEKCVQMLLDATSPLIEAVDCAEKGKSVCQIPRSSDFKDDSPGDDKGDLKNCHKGWHENGDFCIKLFHDPSTWGEAQARCESHGGNLFSQHETDDLYNPSLLHPGSPPEKEESLWIGLRKPSIDEAFQWSDGTPFDFCRWAMDRPKNDSLEKEVCVKETRGTHAWTETNCDDKLPFVCVVYIGAGKVKPIHDPAKTETTKKEIPPELKTTTLPTEPETTKKEIPPELKTTRLPTEPETTKKEIPPELKTTTLAAEPETTTELPKATESPQKPTEEVPEMSTQASNRSVETTEPGNGTNISGTGGKSQGKQPGSRLPLWKITVIVISVCLVLIVAFLLLAIVFRRYRVHRAGNISMLMDERSAPSRPPLPVASRSKTANGKQSNNENIWDYDARPSEPWSGRNYSIEAADADQDAPPSGLGDSSTLDISPPQLASFMDQ